MKPEEWMVNVEASKTCIYGARCISSPVLKTMVWRCCAVGVGGVREGGVGDVGAVECDGEEQKLH